MTEVHVSSRSQTSFLSQTQIFESHATHAAADWTQLWAFPSPSDLGLLRHLVVSTHGISFHPLISITKDLIRRTTSPTVYSFSHMTHHNTLCDKTNSKAHLHAAPKFSKTNTSSSNSIFVSFKKLILHCIIITFE